MCALLGERLAPRDPLSTDALNGLASPSADHWLGTDQLGRDTLSRIVVGAREILISAPLATLAGTALGTAVGLIMGYFGGWTDQVLGRVLEAFLAIPLTIFGIVVFAALGPSRPTGIVAIGVLIAPIVARSVRPAVLAERKLEYVDAAHARSENAGYVLLREILPNVSGVVLVEYTIRLAQTIFLIATLGFLGLGAKPPDPDWGQQIASHYIFLSGGSGEWAVLFPAMAIITLVVGVALMAEALEDALKL